MNNMIISGTVVDNPIFTHEINGERMYSYTMATSRKSGVLDFINCIVPEILTSNIIENSKISVVGEIRTRNEDSEVEGKRRLKIYVFVQEIGNYTGIDENTVNLKGYLCKEPIYRETPIGREICDFIVASNRERNSKSDYIPCITWGRNAQRTARFEISTKFNIEGRLQSREYIKKLDDGTEKTRMVYEVSASRIEVVESEKYDVRECE